MHRLRDLTTPESVYQSTTPTSPRVPAPPVADTYPTAASRPGQRLLLVRSVRDVAAALRHPGSSRSPDRRGCGGRGSARQAARRETLDKFTPCSRPVDGPVRSSCRSRSPPPSAWRRPTPEAVHEAQPIAERFAHHRALQARVREHCEHLVDGAAHTVPSRARAASTGLTVLSTSHEPSGIRGEHLSAVPPLYPDVAVRLFLERAVPANPGCPRRRGSLATVRVDLHPPRRHPPRHRAGGGTFDR